MTTLYVPRDAGALAVGADDVAHALAAALPDARIVRTGSRGLYWLEPLVEVDTPTGRVGYGPVSAADVAGLVAAGLARGGDHPLGHGPIAALPFLARQDRLTFARCGVIDPVDVAGWVAHGGGAGLAAALAAAPDALVEAIVASGLRGRGGAAFPAGIKWRTVRAAPGAPKYVVCNADEGDSGTYADRMLLEGDPLAVLEGMAIAGLAVGAEHGYIYLRSEYPHAERALTQAIAAARAAGYLGDLRGSGRRFDVELRRGAGAYICGEETALLASLEGKRGEVRAKPPLPAHAGLFGRPTLVHNVLTLAAVPTIVADGAAAYAARGTGRSRGTQAFQLAGNVARPGLVEHAFGLTVRALIEDFGGGTASGRPIKAVQIGGPLGPYLPAAALDAPLDYEGLAAAGGMLGHGGVVVLDDTADLGRLARYAMEFCAIESCGKCTPCRIGAVRGVELVDELRALPPGPAHARRLTVLRDLCDTMVAGSLCAMGGMTPLPVRSVIDHFGAELAAPPRRGS